MPATSSETRPSAPVELSARAIVAAALAAAFRDPRTGARQPEPVFPTDLLATAWELASIPYATVKAGELGLGETPPGRVNASDLAAWLGLPAPDRAAVLLRVFGMVVSRECPPLETEFCASKDSFHRAQQMADIAGFYRAFGLTPSPDYPERQDHIALELAFTASLLERLNSAAGRTGPTACECQAVCRDGLAAFVRDHGAWWMPTFARLVEKRVERLLAGTTDPAGRRSLELLAGVTRFLRAWIAAERMALGVEPYRRIVEPAISEETSCDQVCHACPSGASAST